MAQQPSHVAGDPKWCLVGHGGRRQPSLPWERVSVSLDQRTTTGPRQLSRKAGNPNPGLWTGPSPWPVRNQAAQQGSGGRAKPHRCLQRPAARPHLRPPGTSFSQEPRSPVPRRLGTAAEREGEPPSTPVAMATAPERGLLGPAPAWRPHRAALSLQPLLTPTLALTPGQLNTALLRGTGEVTGQTHRK